VSLVSRIQQFLLHFLTYRTITLLTLVFMAMVLGTLWNVSLVSETLVESQATQNAIILAESMRETWSVYSSEAVARIAEEAGVPVTHDYYSQAGAIPLPATFIQELVHKIREKNQGMTIRIYSDYPFPWNQEGGPKDPFEVKALEKLRQNPYEPYVRVESVEGRRMLRYAEASIMKTSCVECHRIYPGSPKTDWKVGDVRGVLTINQTLDEFQAQIRKGLAGTLLLLSSLALVGISALTTALRNLKKQSHQLAIAKEQLEAVINAVPGSIAWISANGMYLGVNQHLAQEWNIAPEAFVGKEINFLHRNDDLAKFLFKLIHSDQSSASAIIDLEIDHDRRSYLVVAQKYQNDRAIVSVAINVTERKQAIESLRIMEEKYRSIYENALEGIFQSSLEGKYINVNPAMAKIYGYDSPEAMVQNIIDITTQIYVEPESRFSLISMLNMRGEIKNFQYRSYRRDKSIIWIEENTRVVRNDRGEILYFEGIVQDITERKQLESAIKRELEELRIEINEHKREQDVAHITESSYFQTLKNEIDTIDLEQFWEEKKTTD
jgi:PAS domain S-box-containing protein